MCDLKIRKNSLLIMIILISYLKPYNVSLIPLLNMMYSLVKVIATLFLIAYVSRKKISISTSSRWCIAFLLWWMLALFRNHNLYSNVQTLLSILGIILLFNIMQKSVNGIEIIIKNLRVIAEIYIILELYTILTDRPIIASAKVSFDKYFLGSDNYSAFIIIPLAGFIMADEAINGRKKIYRTVFVLLCAFLCLAIPQSWAGLGAYTIFVLLLIFKKNQAIIKKFFTIKKTGIVALLFLLSVLVFHVENNLGAVLEIIGKVGLNSREIIWPLAVKLIFKNPVLGYGLLTEKQIEAYWLYGASHAHNMFLDVLLDSGVVGGFLMFMFIKSAVGTKRRDRPSLALTYLSYCLVAYILSSIFDFYITLIYFWVLIICFDQIRIRENKRSDI
ncbi:MAG: O-antigen ligase family protein [Lachnospiraceae bacterium]